MTQDKASPPLTPDELARAAALAAQLYEEDVQRSSAIRAAGEIGVPPDYLARAISRMIDQKSTGAAEQNARTTSIRSVVLGVLTALGFLAVLWPLAIWWGPSPTTFAKTPATNPHIITLKNDPIAPFSRETVSIEPIPLAKNAVVRFRKQNQQIATKMVFRNNTTEKAAILWLDENGNPHMLATVPPGRGYWQSTYVGTPWVAILASGRAGLYFPTANETIADIPANPRSFADSQSTAYEKPLTVGPSMPSAAMLPATTIGSSALDFVSLYPSDVNIYSVGPSHQATYITTLAPNHDFWITIADAGTLWVITDQAGKIVETFGQPAYMAGTAVIAPPDAGGH